MICEIISNDNRKKPEPVVAFLSIPQNSNDLAAVMLFRGGPDCSQDSKVS